MAASILEKQFDQRHMFFLGLIPYFPKPPNCFSNKDNRRGCFLPTDRFLYTAEQGIFLLRLLTLTDALDMQYTYLFYGPNEPIMQWLYLYGLPCT